MKDYKGHAESKRDLMMENPGRMVSWTGYFVALFLAGDWETALSVYETILNMIE